MAINYFDSSNRYTDPVRYFKANDPYYFEVDNIPVKQLEENSKFLKDQVDGLLKRQGREILEPGQSTTLDRVNFNELKPFVDGTDSKVKVMPGRFTARINDAYSQSPLQFITSVFTSEQERQNGTAAYTLGTAGQSEVVSALDKWKIKTASNATLMNGLFERVFVYGMKDINTASDGTDGNPYAIKTMGGGPGGVTTGLTENNVAGWPGVVGMIHQYVSSQDPATKTYTLNRTTLKDSDGFSNLEEYFRSLGRLESEFIKRWRGVTRTSIVDVKEVLEINIPEFRSQDFFYIDSNGEQQQAESSQRIDLLFVYSKAVDQSETSVPSYTTMGDVKVITQPTLGIVKGAGIGVRQYAGDSGLPYNYADLQSIDGVTLMIPNSSDELAENTGFNTSAGNPVRGSFPSPDDLMNLAPLLAESLSTDSLALVGQSILPLAYVVVKSTTSFNPEGEAILTNDDIIDIRPFFRTTELAYNERAGIAAATPQISIANPVVSEARLDYVKEGTLEQAAIATDQKIEPVLDKIEALKLLKTHINYNVEEVFKDRKLSTLDVQDSRSTNGRQLLPFGDAGTIGALSTGYTEFDITQHVGGRVGTEYRPFKLKSVRFQAILRFGARITDITSPSISRSDFDTFSVYLGSKLGIQGGQAIDSGTGYMVITNDFVSPVRVEANGRVYTDIKVLNHTNIFGGSSRVFLDLYVTGYDYECTGANINYEVPNVLANYPYGQVGTT